MADASESDVDVKEAVLLALGDPAFWLLLAVNLVALLITWRLKLDLAGLMLVYWMHSAVTGVTHVMRLRALPEAVRIRKSERDFGVLFGWLHLMFLFFILAATKGRVGH